jgi:four helix bundle protein
MHRFKELKVYQKALLLTHEIRQMTKQFPKDEMFSLTSQMNRAGDSIALNIAEGAGNFSKKEFSKFLNYSIRSSYECIGCLDIALENGFITRERREKVFKNIDEIVAMLVGLQKSLQRHESTQNTDN